MLLERSPDIGDDVAAEVAGGQATTGFGRGALEATRQHIAESAAPFTLDGEFLDRLRLVGGRIDRQAGDRRPMRDCGHEAGGGGRWRPVGLEGLEFGNDLGRAHGPHRGAGMAGIGDEEDGSCLCRRRF